MERRLLFIVFFSFLLFGFSSSEILLVELNKDINNGETFVGFFEADMVKQLTVGDLKVYSGRRIVEFEKGVFSRGNKTFIYVVFSNEGEFRLESNRFLYSSNGGMKEGALNHTVHVGLSGNALTISPGIVVGTNLSLGLINVGNTSLEVKVQGSSINLNKTRSRNVLLNPESSFFYLDVNSYKNFKIPVFYFNDSLEIIQNGSDLNETNVSENGGGFEENVSFFSLKNNFLQRNLTTNETFVFEFLVENLINESIELSISSSSPILVFNKSLLLKSFEAGIFSLEFISPHEGIYTANLTFSFNDSEENLGVLFYISKDGSFEDFFGGGDLFDERVCSDFGDVCVGGQYCSDGGSLSNIGGAVCCVGGICRSYDEIEGPKKNYFGGIIAFLVAAILGFVIYKKFKEAKATSKF